MRILIFSSVFYPALGGIENQTLILTKEFIKLGHTVKVITEQKQFDILENVEVYHSPTILQKVELFFWCDAFYMPNLQLKGIWLMLFNPYKKFIISLNDYSLVDKQSFIAKLKLFLVRFTSRNIAVSKSVAKSIKGKSEIIYNCYDDSTFKLYPDEKRIYDFVFLGRLVSQKGCELLIEACQKLYVPFTLNIIGDGPEKPKLEALVDKLGLNNEIKFLGCMKGEALAKMLNKHKVMIIPSLSEEGFGIVALEGMACGCRIIAADAGGLSEAVNGFGKLFPMGDMLQLRKLLADELTYKTKQNATHHNTVVNHLNNHKRDIISQKYLTVFKQIHLLYAFSQL